MGTIGQWGDGSDPGPTTGRLVKLQAMLLFIDAAEYGPFDVEATLKGLLGRDRDRQLTPQKQTSTPQTAAPRRTITQRPPGHDGGDSRNSPPNSGPKAQGFWGQLSKGDLALIRFACRHDWNPSQPVRNAIVRAVSDQALNDPRPRMVIAAL